MKVFRASYLPPVEMVVTRVKLEDCLALTGEPLGEELEQAVRDVCTLWESDLLQSAVLDASLEKLQPGLRRSRSSCWQAPAGNDSKVSREIEVDGGVVVTLQPLTGKLLLDGHPVGHLPAAILKHELFSRTFDRAAFPVRPLLEQAVHLYVTMEPVRNKVYTFGLLPSGHLLVREADERTEESRDGSGKQCFNIHS